MAYLVSRDWDVGVGVGEIALHLKLNVRRMRTYFGKRWAVRFGKLR
jgi:hypothetical protein